MEIYAVRLTRQGKHLVVDVQTRNGWIEAIRESDDGTTPISHICEQSGLLQACKRRHSLGVSRQVSNADDLPGSF